MKKLLMMLFVGLVALGLTAAHVASAHTGQASITCTSVTFTYASFSGDADNTVSESVTVDGAGVYADTFTFHGSSGGHTIGIAVPQDGQEHLIEVEASWNTNGHSGSFSDSARLVCGEAQPPSPEEPPPPPGPPYTCPDGLPPDGGKDGEPGNDDCDHTQPPSNTVPPTTTPPPTETPSNFEPPPPVETTPPTAETEDAPAIVGKPPVSPGKPAPKATKKAQTKAKGKSIAAKPDTAPQAAPFTL